MGLEQFLNFCHIFVGEDVNWGYAYLFYLFEEVDCVRRILFYQRGGCWYRWFAFGSPQ